MRGSESSLNQTAVNPIKPIGAGVAGGGAGAGASGPGSTAGDETRGGFVLRTRSDPIPHRRRSLVERSGMKSFVQVYRVKLNLPKEVLRISSTKLSFLNEISTAYQQLPFF